MITHQAMNPPAATEDWPHLDSQPTGNWVDYVPSAATWVGRSVTILYEPGFYGSRIGDRPLEICAGSTPDTYHVRLREAAKAPGAQ